MRISRTPSLLAQVWSKPFDMYFGIKCGVVKRSVTLSLPGSSECDMLNRDEGKIMANFLTGIFSLAKTRS